MFITIELKQDDLSFSCLRSHLGGHEGRGGEESMHLFVSKLCTIFSLDLLLIIMSMASISVAMFLCPEPIRQDEEDSCY